MNEVQAGVIGAVENLRNERDELLQLLSTVAAAESTKTPNGNCITVLPQSVMQQIVSRTRHLN